MTLHRNIAANFVGQGWSALMGLAFIPIYVRYLSLESYGLVGFYAILQAALVLLDMSLSHTLNREMARYTAGLHALAGMRRILRSMEVVCAALAVAVGLAIWLTSDMFASRWIRASTLPNAEVANAISAMSIVIAWRMLEGLYRGGLMGLQTQVKVNIATAILATLRWGGAACIVMFVSATATAFFAWQALVSAVSAIWFRHLLQRTLGGEDQTNSFSWDALRGVWHFAGGMLLTALLALLLTQTDKVLLSRSLALEDFGQYTVAVVIANALLQIAGPITQAFYPRLTALVSCQNILELVPTYHFGAQLIAVLVSTPAMMMMAFAEVIVHLWTGNTELAVHVAPLLALLALGTLLNCLMSMPYMLQLAHNWPGLTVRINTVAVFLVIPAIFWVAPRYAGIGVACIWVALNAGYVLLGIHFMHMRVLPQEKWRWYRHDVALPLVLAAAVILTSRMLYPSTVTNHWVELGWLLMTAILATLASSMCIPSIRQRAKSIIGTRLA